jgi:hypothetical protein
MDENTLVLIVLFFAPLAVALLAFISALVLFGTRVTPLTERAVHAR